MKVKELIEFLKSQPQTKNVEIVLNGENIPFTSVFSQDPLCLYFYADQVEIDRRRIAKNEYFLQRWDGGQNGGKNGKKESTKSST